jgi:hypothetical protein
MHFERARSFPTGEINPLIARKCPHRHLPGKNHAFCRAPNEAIGA